MTASPTRASISPPLKIGMLTSAPTFQELRSGKSVFDQSVLAPAVRSGRCSFQRDETSGEIAHPGLVFLVDPRGRLAYTFNNPPAAWVRDGLDRMTGADGEAG